MIHEGIYVLIGKALKGEASNEELLQLEEWKQEHDHNTDTYDQVVNLWEKYQSRMKVDPTFDAENAWIALENEMDQARFKGTRWLSIPAMKVAASIAILALVGAFIYQQYFNQGLIAFEGRVANQFNNPRRWLHYMVK